MFKLYTIIYTHVRYARIHTSKILNTSKCAWILTTEYFVLVSMTVLPFSVCNSLTYCITFCLQFDFYSNLT